MYFQFFFITVSPEITIERSDLGPQGTYQQLLDNGLLKVDNEQTRVVTRLQTLYDEVKNYDKPSSASSLFGRLLSSFPGGGNTAVNSPRGVYLYGSVGTYLTFQLIFKFFFEFQHNLYKCCCYRV